MPAPTPLRTTRRGMPKPKPVVAPPVLVEVLRERLVESRHRGHVVQVSGAGEVVRAIGDPTVVVSMRSTIKPFGLVALIESGAADELTLSTEELAIMAGSVLLHAMWPTFAGSRYRSTPGAWRAAALAGPARRKCPRKAAWGGSARRGRGASRGTPNPSRPSRPS